VGLRKTKNELMKMSQTEMFMELIRDIANELNVDILCHKILMNVSILVSGKLVFAVCIKV
jgi:cGMP-specific 3',5'-cyclic phosphodiesterase